MLKVKIGAGKYVMAVSGGVDSVTLLDLLSKQSGLELVVAHFDHGIRKESAKDRKFVQNLAKTYGVEFVYENGNLGAKVSEMQARDARYEFLSKVVNKHKAKAIITAHHQDDVLETIIMNMLRGTGRKGLSSLQSTSNVIRPLLSYSKQQIKEYAVKNHLVWVEDSTNEDTNYYRNWVRHKIVPKLTEKQRKKLLNSQNKLKIVNDEAEIILDKFIKEITKLNRHTVVMLPHNLTKELLAHWLRKNGINDFDSVLIEKLAIDAKTYASGKKTAIKKGIYVLFTKASLVIFRDKTK